MELNLILLGSILMIVTPFITAQVKTWLKKTSITDEMRKLVTAFSPVVYSGIAWIIDTLLIGINPFNSEGLTVFLITLTGSLVGAKGRDILKYALKRGA